MRIVWARQALRDVAEIHAWLHARKPEAASRMARLILEAVEPLASFPDAGRAIPGSETRVLVVPGTSHVLDYRHRDGVVEILAVTHGARRR